MLKRIIGGIAVGVANVIPGVSGGTMMILMGIFDDVMEAISGLFEKNNCHRQKQLLFLFQVGIGIIIGLVGFAKILQHLFNQYPIQTMYWFIGLIGASIPVFMRKEMKDLSLRSLGMILGITVIFILDLFHFQNTETAITIFPKVTIQHCILMIFIGILSGFSMFLPGVSGSMILLILGNYYLFQSYLASATTLALEVLIPLFFIAIGSGLGMILSAKILRYALKKNQEQTLSFLLGMIIASTIILLTNTLTVSFDLSLIIGCGLSLLLGVIIVGMINIVIK